MPNVGRTRLELVTSALSRQRSEPTELTTFLIMDSKINKYSLYQTSCGNKKDSHSVIL